MVRSSFSFSCPFFSFSCCLPFFFNRFLTRLSSRSLSSLSFFTCVYIHSGLNAMFIKYDVDDSGYLDLDEIARLLSDTAPTTVSDNNEDHANDAIEILRSLGNFLFFFLFSCQTFFSSLFSSSSSFFAPFTSCLCG